jgi:hypothetical protein
LFRYCGIVAAFVADRITQYLRSLNPYRDPDEQWMELEYEKVYRMLLLFSKKRYAGEMTEFDPFDFSDDKKGVALKRRDFCPYTKEYYSKLLKAVFDPDRSIDRAQRIANAMEVVRRGVEDLLNGRVPYKKLVISKSLKDSYSLPEKKQRKYQSKTQLPDFGPANLFVGDNIEWQPKPGVVCTGKIVSKTDTGIANFFGGGKDSSVQLKAKVTEIEPEDATTDVRVGQTCGLQYYDVLARKKGVITLEKIQNPKTTSEELAQITMAHVRLARKMYLRDPGSAPPSGTRVPFVFLENDDPNVLQYERAENPEYAQAHGLKVDPIYYLESQCVNAWGQIINTVQPGVADEIFAEAIQRYSMRSGREIDIAGFLLGDHLRQDVESKQIKLLREGSTEDSNGAEPHSVIKRPRAAPKKHQTAAQRSRKNPKKEVAQSTKITSFFGASEPFQKRQKKK